MNEIFNELISEIHLPLQNPVLIFSLILFIILLSPIVLKKLNIPGIIGLIISGVIIGPYGLNLLEKNSAIELFSTIGLLYIMFIAGLELNLDDFKSTGNKSLVFGGLTFIIPLGLGLPVCYYLLQYDWNASLLIASMFATHTLIAYPIIGKLGISKNEAVAIAVGGTILTDTAVLLLLAVIMGNHSGQLDNTFWIKLVVSLTIFSVFMFYFIPRIARWFFQKLESEKHSHYIFVLSVLFFASFLADVSGVEPIIGAFVSGLALNRLIPHSSALMNRIDFIGNALFIPFFLISVGMLVDVRVLLKGPTALIVAVTLTIVALLGKWLAAFITQLIYKFTSTQRQIIFGLSTAHAAATLAVILVGFKAEILDENVLNGTIILILITCLVASFVTEKAGKNLVLTEELPDTSLNDRSLTSNIEHILVPLENSDNFSKLLDFAFVLKNKKSSSPITILNVVPNDEDAETNILKSKIKFEEYEKQASASEININAVSTIDHNIASGISRMSKELMSDIIVIEWPERSVGILDKFVGEKMDSLLSTANKNIFVCHFEYPLVIHKRIVVVVPPLAERESCFQLWLSKLSKVSKELSIGIHFYCNETTRKAVLLENKRMALNMSSTFEAFFDWEDFLVLSRSINPNDLLVVVSSRKGAVSYIPLLDNIPSKLEKHFEVNNRIIIYPPQRGINPLSESYDDFNTNPLTKGIGRIEKLGKEVSKVFRLGKDK